MILFALRKAHTLTREKAPIWLRNRMKFTWLPWPELYVLGSMEEGDSEARHVMVFVVARMSDDLFVELMGLMASPYC